jgi:hypothetical protein
MRRLSTLVIAAAAVAGGMGASAAVLRVGDAFARPARIPFGSLAADVYWIRAIQTAGRDRRASGSARRFDRLFPMLDLVTSLDPQFGAAYRIGAVLLAEPPPSGPGRGDLACALLQKGLRNSPDRWQYAFDIGFVSYWYGAGTGRRDDDLRMAANWFERAAAIHGAPVWLGPVAAAMRTGAGDLEGARTLLAALSSSDEAWVRRVAEQRLAQLDATGAVDRGVPFALQAASRIR